MQLRALSPRAPSPACPPGLSTHPTVGMETMGGHSTAPVMRAGLCVASLPEHRHAARRSWQEPRELRCQSWSPRPSHRVQDPGVKTRGFSGRLREPSMAQTEARCCVYLSPPAQHHSPRMGTPVRPWVAVGKGS